MAEGAAREICQVYNRAGEVGSSSKEDGSPLTEADTRSHQYIEDALRKEFPNIPLLSEESVSIPWNVRRSWERFFLVDPLDGTKEFLKRNGEFTINIALIENFRPVVGVIFVPVSQFCFSAQKGAGAFVTANGSVSKISAAPVPARRPRVAGSRSHAGPEMNAFLAGLDQPELVSKGSALKLCMIAEGAAHIYPRHGPTSLWDIAAGHCIINEAGGFVCDAGGNELEYGNRESVLNAPFIAASGQRSELARLFSASLNK